MPRPTTATKTIARGPNLPPEFQGLSRFCRPWKNSSKSGVREFCEGGRGFQGPVDMSLLRAKVHISAVASEAVRLPDDCDPLPGGFVTIRRTISIDCTSLVCKYPSAAATRSATRSKNEDGDRPTSGQSIHDHVCAAPVFDFSYAIVKGFNNFPLSDCGHEIVPIHITHQFVSFDILDVTIG